MNTCRIEQAALTGQHTQQFHKYILVNKNSGKIKQLKLFRKTLQGSKGGGSNLMVRGVPISEDITHRQTELKYICEEISDCETGV